MAKRTARDTADLRENPSSGTSPCISQLRLLDGVEFHAINALFLHSQGLAGTVGVLRRGLARLEQLLNSLQVAGARRAAELCGGPVLVVVNGQLLPARGSPEDRPTHGPGLLLALAADAAVVHRHWTTADRALDRRRRETHDVVSPLEAADTHVAEVRAPQREPLLVQVPAMRTYGERVSSTASLRREII